MRLTQTLVKAIVILTVITVALGGAVALGSTLFESPPRDAAEFAARVEAGSTHAAPSEKRTGAERRYVLELNELCARTNESIADLERRVAAADRIARLRSWQRIFARFDRGFRALAAPRRYREDAARAAGLVSAMLELSDGTLEARRQGDRETFDARVKAGELLDARLDQTMLRLEAPVCAVD